jgi:hypothetical protein
MKKFLLALMILTLAGCGRKEEATNQPADAGQAAVGATVDTSVIVPLTVGNRWIYEVSALDTLSNSLKPERVDTHEVLRDTIIEDERWFEVAGMMPPGGLATNRPDGFWQKRPDYETFIFLKYPAPIGEEYKVQLGRSEVFNRLESTGVAITVPAGTFICLKYSQIIQPQGWILDYYIAPGQGGIRMDAFDWDGIRVQMRSELKEIRLK